MKTITLANLAESTDQEVFEFIVTHLRSMKEPCRMGNSCVYRNSENSKCAAGSLMTDEEYEALDKAWRVKSNSSVNTVAWNTLVEAELVPATHLLLIREMQKLHDDSEEWTAQGVCESSLQWIAEDFDLSLPPRGETK